MTGAGRILFCGYNASAAAALKELETERRLRGVVLLTRKNVPRMEGVEHLPLDYLNVENLRDSRVGLSECCACVVFAEFKGREAPRIVDMHTVLTVYNIRKENPGIHLVAEVINAENTPIINDLNCDDIIYKEALDSSLLTSCILHPNISPIIYDLLTVEGKQLKQTTVARMGLEGEEITYRDVRLRALEHNVTLLGYITPRGDISLAPANAQSVSPEYRLVYIE